MPKMRKLPGFFKVYISPSSKRLLIPSAFSSLVGSMPDRVSLRNVNGKLWPVKATNDGNGLFFTDGWAEFVEDNSVEIGDFLVFDYDGRTVFNVRLLARTGCEKLGTASSAFKIKEEQKGDDDDDDDTEEAAEDEMEEDGEDEEKDDHYSHDDEADETDGDEDESDETDGDYMESDEADETDGDEDYEDEDNLRAETPGTVKKRGKKEQSSSSKRSKSTDSKTSRGGGYRRKPDIKGEEDGCANTWGLQKDDDIFKYGVIPWPKNPFFVAKIKEKRPTQLSIPKDVIEDHKLKIPSSIALIDEGGKEWTGLVKEWKDGRRVEVRGWKAFCKWNRVSPEDRCICEFIQGKGRLGIFLKMRILRKGSWLPKH